VNTYNIVQATPFRRDPMRELRDACRKYGVKFGFYYSHAFDWGEADAPGNDWDYNNPGGDKLLGGANWWETRPEFLPKARGYVDRKAIPQLRELVAEYQPDILWFDTPHKLPPAENQRILDAVRAMAPGVVVNGRLMRGAGDYESTADRPAEFSPHDGDWEGIPTTNESYGWNKFDRSHKPVSHFIRILAKAVARGGNILMNIGPMGDGTFDPADVAILDGIGAWWKVNGESIRGAGRSPLAVQTWGESTLKGSRLYLHVFDWPADGRLVVGGLKTPVTSAWLLAKGASKRRAVTRLNPLDVSVALPSEAPDRSDAVVVLELGGAVDADVVRLLQPSFTNETLRAFDAQLHGGLRFGPGKRTDDYVLGWSSMSDNVTWRVRLPAITTYEVDANYDAPAASAGGSYTVAFGAQKLSGTVSSGTGQRVRLGRVTLAPGAFDITVTATTIAGAELLRLRGLTLISYRPASR
ncbi:MAG TPA: alpha-L-fucosidase, partial [Vicinamibacterales bacterium]|nr:alpha-L-fucosidase [Vicinamibacterales bacterium]